MRELQALHAAIAAQNLPITSVRLVDAEMIELDFPDNATPEQRQAAQAILDGWIEPAMPPDWVKLQASFRGTALMGKCFTAAGIDLACNAAFTMLYGAITQTRSLEDFEWSLGQLRLAMTANPEIGDFSPEEIQTINEVLVEAGFSTIA